MPQPIVVPQRRNPWTQFLPQMIMMKMRQNFMSAERDKRLDYGREVREQEREANLLEGGYQPMMPQRPGQDRPDLIGKIHYDPTTKKAYRKPPPTAAEQPFVPRSMNVSVGGKNYSMVETERDKFKFTPTEKKPTTKRVWSKTKQAYVERTQEQINKNPDDYFIKDYQFLSMAL